MNVIGVKLPNILITGTPGTGKTTLANEVARQCNLRFLSINDVAEEGTLYDGYDDENECHILDEDRIVDELEESISAGGQVVLDEARDSYKPDNVYELQSNTLADLEENISRICNWIKEWKSRKSC